MKKAVALCFSLGVSSLASAIDMSQGQSAHDLMSSDDLKGKNVMSSSGEKVGDVDAIVFGDNSTDKLVIIGLSGVVGDGAKEVAVPMSVLRVADDGRNLIVNTSRAALESQPDVDVRDYREVDEES